MGWRGRESTSCSGRKATIRLERIPTERREKENKDDVHLEEKINGVINRSRILTDTYLFIFVVNFVLYMQQTFL